MAWDWFVLWLVTHNTETLIRLVRLKDSPNHLCGTGAIHDGVTGRPQHAPFSQGHVDTSSILLFMFPCDFSELN